MHSDRVTSLMHPGLVLFPLAASLLLLNDRASADDCAPATCGKLALRYPFWLGNINQTSSSCGHPAFEVWCGNDSQSTASLRGSTLHVHAINYTNNSLIVFNDRFAGDDGVCRTDSNMSIAASLTLFQISRRNRALCFLYDCSGTSPTGSEYVNATSNCSAPIYAYLGETYTWGKPPEITLGRCSYTYIPVLGSEAATMTAANYSRLLNDGFVMEWEAAGIGDCAACNAGGGQCRYDNATAAFRCLCLDGRRTGSTCAVQHNWLTRPSGSVGSKKLLFLELTNLMNGALADIKGPVLEVKSYLWGGGYQSVEVSFDARKVPFEIVSGIPEQGVAFCGSRFLSEDEAQHDTVIKVAEFLYSKFGIRFVDWSYVKAVRAEQNLRDIDGSIQSIVSNINGMLKHWKASVNQFQHLEKALASTPNPEHMALYGKLITLKCTVKTTLEKISQQMTLTENQHYLYHNESSIKISEDARTVKLPETDIINAILRRLDLKHAEFMNRFVEDDMFLGICKIAMNGLFSSKSCGPTIFEGDVKRTAHEAECSAAVKAISFLERSMGLQIVDINFNALRQRQDWLRGLECAKNKYITIANEVSAEWKSMMLELKAMVNYQCEFCQKMDKDDPDNCIACCAQILDEILADTTLLYDLSTTKSE